MLQVSTKATKVRVLVKPVQTARSTTNGGVQFASIAKWANMGLGTSTQLTTANRARLANTPTARPVTLARHVNLVPLVSTETVATEGISVEFAKPARLVHSSLKCCRGIRLAQAGLLAMQGTIKLATT